MRLAVDELKVEIASNNITNWTLDEAERFNSIQLISGYPDNLIEDSFLERIYGKIILDGSETLFESFRAINRHQKSINFLTLSEDDQMTLAITNNDKTEAFACAVIDLKYLCKLLPLFSFSKFMILSSCRLSRRCDSISKFPWGPKSVLQHGDACSWNSLLSQYFFRNQLIQSESNMKTYSFPKILLLIQDIDLASRIYKKWLQINGPESSLPGFLLTNEQMFWVAFNLRFCRKKKQESWHRDWNPSEEFRKDYNCTN